jgi:hypothetical protein
MVSSDNDSTNNNSITCTSSILVVTTTNSLKLLTMQYILTCPNGKKIDMTSDVLKQMKGEITREDVTNKIQSLMDNNIK